MSPEAQLSFVASAVDALDGIRAEEVADVSAEVRRKITRHMQIVPEIANLVAQKRAKANRGHTHNPYFLEKEIYEKADEMRAAAKGDRRKLSDAFEWERQARIDAGLHVQPYPKPLTRYELDNLPPAIVKMGLNSGFLKRENGQLVECPVG